MNSRLESQSFLGPTSADILAACRVAVVGLGGGGSHVVQQLSHLGVGHFLLFDPDRVEDRNLNRLVGATAADAKAATLKTVVAERLLRGMNEGADIRCVSQEWQRQGIALRDCDVIFGCLDGYSNRNELERVARRFLIPYIDIGMDVTAAAADGDFVITGQVILSSPGELCLWCLGFLREDLLAREAERYGNAGARPQVIWPNGVLASAAVGIFVNLITPWHSAHCAVEYLEYDGNDGSLSRSNRLAAVQATSCRHFDRLELGDPFFPNTRT